MSAAKANPELLRTTLRDHFGHADFRDGQEKVITALLQGRSSLALFPTGAGKSLCYQLPALLLDGLTLVISPLIALMKDQVESLRARGIAAARLDSTLSATEVEGVFDAMSKGKLRLLFIAPERLIKEAFVQHLQRTKIALMAIDEAHCISEWGHNFRPEYLRLAHVAKRLKIHPVLALTATATPEVAADVRRAFDIAPKDHIQTSFRRPNLSYHITPCTANERLPLLTQRLQKLEGAAIVYVTLQQTAEHVATHLQRSGLSARAYHAGLPDDQRSEAQDAFMQGQTRIIVATIAFGMGIDKADIRAVFHYNLPKTIENFQQETGRAGRDGLPATCEMLACGDDRIVLENFVFGDTPTAQSLRQLTDHLLRQSQEFDLSLYDLSHSTDIKSVVIETVLTHLELEGILRPLGSFYASYQFRLLQPLDRIISGHSPSRKTLLTKLLNAGKRGSKWTTLTLNDEAIALDEEPARLIKALSWLAEAGDIELRPSHIRQRYELCGDPTTRDPGVIAKKLCELFADRESRDVERLEQVLKLAAHPGCLQQWLLAYFGEKMPNRCGQCSSCEERPKKPRIIPQTQRPPIEPEAIAAMHEVMAERHAALRSARQIARFFCGLTSPATTRNRLTRHDSFGMLDHLPFADVLIQTESITPR
ncbi:MAG: RecQ family ATP-dependent DNA helicase [Verrucomicrobiaceae bacterium]|nr:RecQ family ATP-dependent DNA helicase [Verrucomicrobiaceae bacterium]